FDLRQVLHPLVLAIRDKFQQTTHLACLTGGEISYIDKVEANIRVPITSLIGGPHPAPAPRVGEATLGPLPGGGGAVLRGGDDAVRDWVNEHGPLLQRTPHTATTAEQLAEALRAVREKGFAVDNEESEPGLVCVAACVPMVFGELSPLTAVSVTGLRDPMCA